FYAEVEKAGFAHLGEVMDSAERRAEPAPLPRRPFFRKTRGHWVDKMRAAGIVSAPNKNQLRAADAPDSLATGYVTEVDYPKHGKRLRVHGTPWQFSQTPANIGSAPALGEHNGEVLASLGYSEAAIQGLRERKII